MRIHVIFGILLIFTGTVMGLLFQDPVVCRFNQRNQCCVALGQRLHLQMVMEDGLVLNKNNGTFDKAVILRYRKTQSNPPKPNSPKWQCVNDNKTIILITIAERSDSGTYTLDIFDAKGNKKDNYTLQLNTEATVSSVKVTYSCLSPELRKVCCSADGDNLHFHWNSDLIKLTQLEDENSAFLLDKNNHGNVSCHVKNHVSHDHNTIAVHPCPGFMVFLSVWLFEVIILVSLFVGAFYIYTRTYTSTENPGPGSSVNLN
ncbi:uncharacterized protein LOC113527892 isoform X2 [Pangasianodon hypophthalmus]|uniref:uncharacterized protein LOC113527892 isoform X2 n=1 Tax=Pangasianodon hypophthalmus TaxID=310915 RepID=UPI00230783BB|nr:uncharacterized protein LOC113527892 isoform X2 [Pangasianodon hypophthalmus]